MRRLSQRVVSDKHGGDMWRCGVHMDSILFTLVIPVIYLSFIWSILVSGSAADQWCPSSPPWSEPPDGQRPRRETGGKDGLLAADVDPHAGRSIGASLGYYYIYICIIWLYMLYLSLCISTCRSEFNSFCILLVHLVLLSPAVRSVRFCKSKVESLNWDPGTNSNETVWNSAQCHWHKTTESRSACNRALGAFEDWSAKSSRTTQGQGGQMWNR